MRASRPDRQCRFDTLAYLELCGGFFESQALFRCFSAPDGFTSSGAPLIVTISHSSVFLSGLWCYSSAFRWSAVPTVFDGLPGGFVGDSITGMTTRPRPFHRLALRLAIFVLVCAVNQDALAIDPPPSAAELREWAAGPCTRAAKHAGIDYALSLDRAVALDPAGLAALLRFTDTGWFDGAAAEGHCAILFGLLQRWGDRPFARVLGAQKQPVRKAVTDAITTFPGWSAARFPQTNASMRH